MNVICRFVLLVVVLLILATAAWDDGHGGISAEEFRLDVIVLLFVIAMLIHLVHEEESKK